MMVDLGEVYFGAQRKKTDTVPLNREPAGGVLRIKKAK